MKPLCAILILIAATAAGAPVDITPVACETFTLDNGIRCVVAEKHDTPMVAIHVYVNAGLVHEGEYCGSGISHYIEHMAAEAENALGTTANAYTTVDHVCYHCAVLRGQWDDATAKLAACVTNGVFPATLCAREKGVIAQEIRMDDEEPDAALGRLLDETIYLRSPLRAPLAGWLDCFTNLTSADVAAYYRRQYVGNNMIVAVAGDVTVAEAKKTIERAFGCVCRGKAPITVVPEEPRPLAPRSAAKRFNVNEAQCALAFPGVSLNDPDMCALDLLAGVMADGNTSILVKRLKDELQLVYRISAGSWSPFFCQGTFTIDFSCDETNADAVVRQVLGSLDALKSAPVEPGRLDRVRRTMLTHRLRALQDVDSIAGSMADGIMMCGNPNFDTHYLRGILAVTTNDLLRAARRIFDTNAMTTAMLLPMHGTGQADACVASVTNRPATAFDVTRLPNGMRLALRPVSGAGLVGFSLCMPGGLAFETAENNGISMFTASTMTKGTPRQDADAFSAALESLGASLDVTAARESLCATAECLPGDVETIVAMLAGTVLEPTFPAVEIEKQRRLQLGAIRTRNDDWYPESMLAFNHAFFGQHAYAMPQSGESNAVARLTRSDIAAFHRRLVQPSNMVLAVAGEFDPGAMRTQVVRMFGGAAATAPPLPMCARHVPPATNSTAIVRTAREQAAVMVGYAAPALGDADRYAAMVAEAAPRGFDGALFKALRGVTNLVYVATAVPVMEMHAGAMVCLAQCEPGNVPCVIATMTNVVAAMAREPLSADRLARTKVDMETAQFGRWQTLQGQASLAALDEYRGLGANAFLETPAEVNKVSAAAARAVVQKHFTTWTCVVTMPEGK